MGSKGIIPLMFNFYYPAGTEKIWHKSKTGRKYRLDSLNRMLLLKNLVTKKAGVKVFTINKSDDSILSLAHSSLLIKSYKTGKPRHLAESSGVLFQKDFYGWMVNKAWAHIKAAEKALNEKTVAVALTDGGHHAEKESGYGFSPINSMIIASQYLKNKRKVRRVAMLDLDVHYGNGTHFHASKKPWILTTDLWRYKLDKWTFTKSEKNIFHQKIEKSEEYLKLLPNVLEKIEEFKPDLIWYYLGLDVLETDRTEGIEGFNNGVLRKRNQITAEFFSKLKIPTVISIGGGYVNYQLTSKDIEEQKTELTNLFWESVQKIYKGLSKH